MWSMTRCLVCIVPPHVSHEPTLFRGLLLQSFFRTPWSDRKQTDHASKNSMREGCYGKCASQLARSIHDGSAHRAVALRIVWATRPHCAWHRCSGDSRRGTAFLVYLLEAVSSNRLLRDRSNARASDR